MEPPEESSSEEGESPPEQIAFVVDHAEGRCILDFSHRVKWVAMSPALARETARALIKHAELAEKQDG